MEPGNPIYEAIDRGGGQACDVAGVIRELAKAGYTIVPIRAPAVMAELTPEQQAAFEAEWTKAQPGGIVYAVDAGIGGASICYGAEPGGDVQQSMTVDEMVERGMDRESAEFIHGQQWTDREIDGLLRADAKREPFEPIGEAMKRVVNKIKPDGEG